MLKKMGRDALLLFEENQDGGEGSGPTVEQLAAQLEQVQKQLKAANAESAQRRRLLDEIEAANKQKADAELTESQKAQKRAEEAEQRIKDLEKQQRDAAIRHAVEITAGKLNFFDPQDAYSLADLTGVTLVDGKPTGIDAALQSLAKSKPHLVKPSGGDTNAAARGQQRQPTQNDLVSRKLGSGAYTPF